ncbi:hypothetical protein BDN70DRAFT_884316 [Pholiota conissans]|uniref:Uncharacterized protein n=1 Tax=Pholiota conissans TaxID=109636 RepID=A0A9P5YTP2_9AGAR|nr:hypothetical protein BDN70DRAFT_884316 [Pholiota conissans]
MGLVCVRGARFARGWRYSDAGFVWCVFSYVENFTFFCLFGYYVVVVFLCVWGFVFGRCLAASVPAGPIPLSTLSVRTTSAPRFLRFYGFVLFVLRFDKIVSLSRSYVILDEISLHVSFILRLFCASLSLYLTVS